MHVNQIYYFICCLLMFVCLRYVVVRNANQTKICMINEEECPIQHLIELIRKYHYKWNWYVSCELWVAFTKKPKFHFVRKFFGFFGFFLVLRPAWIDWMFICDTKNPKIVHARDKWIHFCFFFLLLNLFFTWKEVNTDSLLHGCYNFGEFLSDIFKSFANTFDTQSVAHYGFRSYTRDSNNIFYFFFFNSIRFEIQATESYWLPAWFLANFYWINRVPLSICFHLFEEIA